MPLVAGQHMLAVICASRTSVPGRGGGGATTRQKKAHWPRAVLGANAWIYFACVWCISLLPTKIQVQVPDKQFLVQVENHHLQIHQFLVPDRG